MIVKKLNDKILVIVRNEETGNYETETISIDVWRERVRQGNQHADEIETGKSMHPDICLGYRIERCGCRFDDDDRYVKEAEQSLAAMAKLPKIIGGGYTKLWQGHDNGKWYIEVTHRERNKQIGEGDTITAAILAIEENS